MGVQQVSRRYHQFAGRDNVDRHLAMHAAVASACIASTGGRQSASVAPVRCASAWIASAAAYGIALQLGTQRVPILGDNRGGIARRSARGQCPFTHCGVAANSTFSIDGGARIALTVGHIATIARAPHSTRVSQLYQASMHLCAGRATA